MAEFTIVSMSVSEEIHNTVVTLHCKTPNSETHDVKVYVSDILQSESGLEGNIVSAVQSWAEPQLRAAASLENVKELRMHTRNAD